MGTRATLTVSLILIVWSVLLWLNRAEVGGYPVVQAGVWMAAGLALTATGLTGLWKPRDAAAEVPRRPAVAWLIGSLPVFGLLAPQWRFVPYALTDSSYAGTLSGSMVLALAALTVAVARPRRPADSLSGQALRWLGIGAGVAALVLVGVSIWTHVRIDHSASGTYGEMGAALFVVAHPVFWAVAIAAAFALWWPGHGRRLAERHR